MIIPLKVDVPQDRRPFVNWLIIAGIIVVFVLQVVVLMLKRRWIEVERYEKSLLQMWQERKKPVKEGFGPSYGMLRSERKDEKLESATVVRDEQRARPAEPKRITMEPEEPEEEFIRFTCSCGKGVKVAVQYAGRTGQCPRCKKRVRIPEKP